MQYSRISTFPSLPVPVIPLPWEDLASLVSRVAAEMGYKNTAWILRPEEIPSDIQPYNLCLLRRVADYQFLEHILRLDEEMTYGLTLHRFASRLQVSEVFPPDAPGEVQRPLLTRYIFQTFFHPYSATKVCSACLAEEPVYARLYWSALPVVACLCHRIFLTDRCPACQYSIPLLRPSLVNCPRCKKGDYREVNPIPMMEDPLFCRGQTLILQCLGIEPTALDADAADERMSPLLKLLPWQYFLLLDAFRCIIGPLFPDAPLLRASAEARVLLRQRSRPQSQLSLLEWSVMIATFHSLFTSWPDNFFAFLDAFPHARSERRTKRDQQRATGLHRDFGVFYERWLYRRLTHPAFAFLHEAFETYLRERYMGGEVTRRLLPFKNRSEQLLQGRAYLTKVQARTMLGIGEDVLQALISQGTLRTYKKPMGSDESRTMFLIDKESAQALLCEWKDLIPLEVVARSYLGVSKAVVIALEGAGVLLPKRGPTVDGYKFRLYSQADISQFEKTLLLHSKKASESPPDCVSLPKCSTIVGIPLVDLLKETFEGHFTLVEIDAHQPLLQRFVLPRAGIPDFIKEYKQQRCEMLGILTSYQVARELQISENVLKRWVRSGLLKGKKLAIDGKKPTLLFQREALEAFQRTYVFMEGAAQLLGVVPNTVSKYVRKGILHPVVGRSTDDGGTRLLFLREEIESLLLPVSLTVEEVAKLLGVSRSHAYRLVRTGELPSVRHSNRGSKWGIIGLLLSDIEVYQHKNS